MKSRLALITANMTADLAAHEAIEHQALFEELDDESCG